MLGLLYQGNPFRVFDWHKAAEIIRDRRPELAAAGLEDDWENTGGSIYYDGKPVPAEDTYTYLASTWATPQLNIDGEIIDCWVYEDDSPGWGSGTYWPESALAILNGTQAQLEPPSRLALPKPRD
jgi:hypothetical protein